MDQKRFKFHVAIADKHKHFIGFLQQCAEAKHEKFPEDNFSVWLVIASYYRAIHLLEAFFAKDNKPVLSGFDHYSADSRRQGFLIGFPAMRKEFKSLQRLAFHCLNFRSLPILCFHLSISLPWRLRRLCGRILPQF